MTTTHSAALTLAHTEVVAAAAYSSDGVTIAGISDATGGVLRNIGAFAVEYRVSDGAWSEIAPRGTVVPGGLDIALRKSRHGAASTVRVEAERLVGIALGGEQTALFTRGVDVASASAVGPQAMQLSVGGVLYNPTRSITGQGSLGTYYIPMFGPV